MPKQDKQDTFVSFQHLPGETGSQHPNELRTTHHYRVVQCVCQCQLLCQCQISPQNGSVERDPSIAQGSYSPKVALWKEGFRFRWFLCLMMVGVESN